MGLIMLLGGLFGSTTGIWIFGILKRIGQIDLTIAIGYVVLLSSIGVDDDRKRRHLAAAAQSRGAARELHQHYLVHRLPLKMRFYRSRLYIARCCRWAWVSASACSPRSSASAAASSWCRR